MILHILSLPYGMTGGLFAFVPIPHTSIVAPSTPPRSKFCLKFAVRDVRGGMWQPLHFWLHGRTIFGGNLLQAIVLWLGNGNVRAREDIFAVLGGRSDHKITAGALHDARAALTHKIGTVLYDNIRLEIRRRQKAASETKQRPNSGWNASVQLRLRSAGEQTPNLGRAGPSWELGSGGLPSDERVKVRAVNSDQLSVD